MARRESTTTATLEDQAAIEAELGLEELPTFEDLPESREALLQSLDARDDALNANGHTNAHGIRPSEQCGVVAGHGPYPGSRCTYAEHPMNQPHSWEITQPTDEQPGHVYDDAEQPTLPGTPEPERADWQPPTEASFGSNGKLQPAQGLQRIGDALIAADDDLEHLRGIEIRYAWRRRGGTQGGNPRFARIKKPSVWEAYLTGLRATFLLDVSADHIREYRFTETQVEAALYDQLIRTARDEDDHDAFRVNGPDFSGNIRTIDKYGTNWHPDLREMHAHVAKLPLEQAIDEADASDDGEDGGDEE